MKRYRLLKMPGASPEVIQGAINDIAKLGYELEFVDSGWFILGEDYIIADKEDDIEEKGGNNGDSESPESGQQDKVAENM